MNKLTLGWVCVALMGCGGAPRTPQADTPSPSPDAKPAPVAAASSAAAPSPPLPPPVKTDCPAGTRAAGASCVANGETTCPPGYDFELGVGCLVSPKSQVDDGYRAAMASYQAWVGAGPKPGTGPEARGKAFGSLQAAWKSTATEPASKVSRVEIASRLAELLKIGDEKEAPLWFRRTIEAYQASGAPKGTRPAELAAAASYFLAEKEVWDTFDFDTGHLRVTDTDAKALAKLDVAAKEGERLTALFAPVADPATFGSYRWAVEARARQASVTRSLVHAHLYVLSASPKGDVKGKLETAVALLREGEVRRLVKVQTLAAAFGVTLPVLVAVDKRMGELEKELPASRFRAAAGR